MSKRLDWPRNAEYTRQDCIALYHDIQALMVTAYAAMMAGDEIEAAVAMGAARSKARAGQEMLRAARSDVGPLDDELSDALDEILANEYDTGHADGMAPRKEEM